MYINAGCAVFFIKVCRLMTTTSLLLFHYEVLELHFTSQICEVYTFIYNCGGLLLTWSAQGFKGILQCFKTEKYLNTYTNICIHKKIQIYVIYRTAMLHRYSFIITHNKRTEKFCIGTVEDINSRNFK